MSNSLNSHSMSTKILFIEHESHPARFKGMSDALLKAETVHAYRWDGNHLLERRHAEKPWMPCEEIDSAEPVLLCLRHGGDQYTGACPPVSLRICYGGGNQPDHRRVEGEYCFNRSVVNTDFLTADEARQILDFAKRLAASQGTASRCPDCLIPPISNSTREDNLREIENEWLNT